MDGLVFWFSWLAQVPATSLLDIRYTDKCIILSFLILMTIDGLSEWGFNLDLLKPPPEFHKLSVVRLLSPPFLPFQERTLRSFQHSTTPRNSHYSSEWGFPPLIYLHIFLHTWGIPWIYGDPLLCRLMACFSAFVIGPTLLLDKKWEDTRLPLYGSITPLPFPFHWPSTAVNIP